MTMFDPHRVHMAVGEVLRVNADGTADIVIDEDGTPDTLEDVAVIGTVTANDQVVLLTADLETWAIGGGSGGGFVNIGATVPDVQSLPTHGVHAGEVHYVTSTGDLYIYGADGQWHNAGHLQGPQGPAGSPGAPGAVGPAGPTGPAGVQGAVGPQGNPGPRGNDGPTGATGPQGVEGPAGTQGAQGVPGPAGPAGPTGSQGVQGIKGDQGDALKIDVFTRMTAWPAAAGALPAGLLPAVTASGGPEIHTLVYVHPTTGTTYNLMMAHTPGDATVHTLPGTIEGDALGGALTLPAGWQYVGVLKGVRGATGSQGVQGVAGPPGPAGPTGMRGIQGVAGPQGTQGPHGPAGPRGQSAFDIYVAGGGDLDETSWLDSLQGPPGQDGQDGADADLAQVESIIRTLVPSLLALNANDLLSVDSAGKLYAPVLPGSAGVYHPTDITVSATAQAAGRQMDMAETIRSPSPLHALKVDVHVMSWHSSQSLGTNPPAMYSATAVSAGAATFIGEVQARTEVVNGYQGMNTYGHYIIPPGGTATFVPVFWTTSAGAGRVIKYAKMTVVPVGYEASGTSRTRSVGSAAVPAGTVVPRPPATTTPAPQTRTATSSSSGNSVRTYKGDGSQNTYNWDGRRVYYGRYSATNGDQRGMVLFDSGFRSKLRGMPANSIQSVRITFSNLHTFNNAGGTVKITMATAGSLPGTLGSVSGPVVAASVTVPKSGSVTVSMPASLYEQFRTSGTGFIFSAATGGQAGYGYLDGKSVSVKVTYRQ